MRRTITVTGQGAVRVTPDSAVVRVAALHRAPGVAEAFRGVDSAVTAMAEIARRHVDPAKVASTELSVWPAYGPSGEPAGFEARHGLAVSVADLPQAGTLLSALTEEVGDRLTVEGVSLEVADPAAHLPAARERAFADARARAEQLAGLSGAVLGEVVAVVEGGGGYDVPVAAAAELRAGKDAALEPGERALAASLTVTWALTNGQAGPTS